MQDLAWSVLRITVASYVGLVLARITCPVLVAHSPDDDLIPYSHGEKLFRAAREPKVFLALKGSHNGGRDQTGKSYDEGVDGFLTRFLGPRPATVR